jgi:hypothetical protein
MKFLNMTGHDVYVYADGKLARTFDASDSTVRVQPVVESYEDCEGVHISTVSYKPDQRYALPLQADDTLIIVSYMIANYFKATRQDLVYPFDIVRGNGGKVIGCKGFARPL